MVDIPGERFEEIVETHLATLGIEDLKYFLSKNNNEIDINELYNCKDRSVSLDKRFQEIKETFVKNYPNGVNNETKKSEKFINTA